ncbi:MAG TPA: membrane protein insertase YidC [Steroidobacteraceae bacterium]|nr:membrane protein insertase YidC [Steroidobacteraceae bacterium]
MTSNYPRYALWGLLGLALWLNYQAWMRDYGVTSSVPVTGTSRSATAPATSSGSLDAAIPSSSTAQTAAAPRPATESQPAATTTSASEGGAGGEAVRVRTDVLDLLISLKGGTLIQADLPKYPRVKGEQQPVRLENRDSPETRYVLDTGLAGPAGQPRPTHLANFTSPQSEYVLADGRDELRVPLEWSDGHGVTVTKEFVLHRGGYQISVLQSVQNGSDAPWSASPYAELLRDDPPQPRRGLFNFNVESYSFRGPAIYDAKKFRKLNLSDAEDRHLSLDVKSGWLAALQHHFLTAIIPPADAPYLYTLSVNGLEYALAAGGPTVTVAPGSAHTFPMELFVGPKLQAQLAKAGPELQRAADYGRLYFISDPLFWLLEHVYALLHNWGWSIIVVTFMLKLVFYPLSEASGRSMAKMKSLGPRIKNIQETYKDDREKSGRAMMELYKREKVNPVTGCLPTIVQIPVFFAFYWVLIESVEMRQAPFMGWIHDLSSRDPYFVLPAIMAAAMFVQYKLNPAPADPVQARVMMIMPLAMSVTFAFFPAGLVLYWVTNTLLSIAQQWNINRRIEAAKKT